MDGFTIIDGVVALIVVVSALLAYGRGLVRELMAIVGWVGAAIVAYIFSPQVEPITREIPIINEFLGTNCNEITIVFAFAVVLVAALIVFSLFTPLFSTLIQRSVLSGVDQALGFLFGIVRGLLLVAVAFFAYETVFPTQEISYVDDSRSAAVFMQFTDRINAQDPENALQWLSNQSTALVNACGQ
jgi:membrane protein required for colicin V production